MRYQGSVSTIAVPVISNSLFGVVATSPTEIWAVGERGGYSRYRTLVEQYENLCSGSPTNTPLPTSSRTPTPPRPTVTATNVSTATQTATNTSTPVATSTPRPTNTPVPVQTNTPVPVPSGSPTNTPVPVPTNTPVPLPTFTPPPSPTACAVRFTDVQSGSTFYEFVRCLACRSIISGYSDGTFRPNNEVTRGQLAKIVSNAAGFNENPNPQLFEDVLPGSTFYEWINRLARRGHMSGYACGGLGEPCTTGMPYLLPFANATRGQTSPLVSNSAGYAEIPTDQTFQEGPPSHTFYRELQRLASRSLRD